MKKYSQIKDRNYTGFMTKYHVRDLKNGVSYVCSVLPSAGFEKLSCTDVVGYFDNTSW